MIKQVFILFIVLAVACGKTETESPAAAKQKEVPAKTAVTEQATVQESLPALPAAVFDTLFSVVTRIDVISYRSGVSIGVDERNVPTFKNMISPGAAASRSCEYPGARADFIIDGELYVSGEVFFDQPCSYVNWSYNGSDYANALTPFGAQFFREKMNPKPAQPQGGGQ